MVKRKSKKVYIVISSDNDVLGVFKTKPNRMKFLKAIGADDSNDEYYMGAKEWAMFNTFETFIYP